MKWVPFELHTHTNHSDGEFTVQTLCEAARSKGLSGLALTDHNTNSGVEEFLHTAEALGLQPVPGIEWTLFYGHMLVLNTNRFIGFHHIAKDGMDAALREIKSAGGVTILAHPWSFSNPLATGYHWEYRISAWDCVDAMEVWHGSKPHRNPFLQAAFTMWEDHLGAGRHMTATYGRDWHRVDAGIPDAVTLLGMEEGDTPCDAIRRGRTVITVGPVLTMEAAQGGAAAVLGGSIPAGETVLRISVNEGERSGDWSRFGFVAQRIVIVANGRAVAKADIVSGEAKDITVNLLPGWVRAELHGTDPEGPALLAFTSVIYVL